MSREMCISVHGFSYNEDVLNLAFLTITSVLNDETWNNIFDTVIDLILDRTSLNRENVGVPFVRLW